MFDALADQSKLLAFPAVCLVHVALVPVVQVLYTLMGAVDYPFVVIDYPYLPTANSWTVDECNVLTNDVLGGVRERGWAVDWSDVAPSARAVGVALPEGMGPADVFVNGCCAASSTIRWV